MKPHYFEQPEADQDDMALAMAKQQGYVPLTCLLGGATVMSEVSKGRDACYGCNGPRNVCGGRPHESAYAAGAASAAEPAFQMGGPTARALPPLPAQITCVKREIAMRERAYPKWVEANRMTQAKADQELLLMQAVLLTLENLHRERNPGLFE